MLVKVERMPEATEPVELIIFSDYV